MTMQGSQMNTRMKFPPRGVRNLLLMASSTERGETVVGLGAGAAYDKLDLTANASATFNNSTSSTQDAYKD
jgi:hypothetical protein